MAVFANMTRPWLWVFAIVLVISGCESAPEGPPISSEPQNVRLILRETPDARYGGFFAASVSEYYQAVGLDVAIEVEPGTVADLVAALESGQATFGVLEADEVLLGRSAGAKIVAVMASLQITPRSLIVHQEAPVRQIQELANAEVLAPAESAVRSFLRFKFPAESVEFPSPDRPLDAFLQQPQAVLVGYETREAFEAERHGAAVRTFSMVELGYNPYGSVLVTTEATLAQDPELVHRFLRASALGWRDYLTDSTDANATIAERFPEVDHGVLDLGAQILRDRKLVLGESLGPEQLGRMTPAAWTDLAGSLRESSPERFRGLDVQAAFTTMFYEDPTKN
jgi:NitT/TauT family transport system substrate-binding protein